MTNKAIQYLESHRTFTITINANTLVDTATEALKVINNSVEGLIAPEVTFNTNEIEYLQLTLRWETEDHLLDIEIIDGRSNAFVYYEDFAIKESRDNWYRLDEPLPEWLIKLLLLFTNQDSLKTN